MAPAADEPEHDLRALRVVAVSDVELLCRIAERDRHALEVLYRRYVRAVYGLALRWLGDRKRAKDATRRVFAAIWRSPATYAPEHAGDARWVFEVARKAIVDETRRGSRQQPAADAGLSEEDAWLAFRVHAAVADLPERERMPLELAYWRGCSRNQIAELLGLPVAVVEVRTRSALARLAARLEGPEE